MRLLRAMNSDSEQLSAAGDNNQIVGETEEEQRGIAREEGLSFSLKSEETILNEEGSDEKHLRETVEGEHLDKDCECDSEQDSAFPTSPPASSGSTARLDVSPLDVMELALGTHWELLSSEARYQLSLIPEGYQPVPHQVGGHRHIDGKQGVCVCVRVCKLLSTKPILICDEGKQLEPAPRP